MRKIAVVSKNKALCRLVELEAISCGASARSFSAMPRDILNYSLIILDADTVTVQLTGKEEQVYTVGSNVIEGAPRAFCYPPPLRELRAIIVGSEKVGRESFDGAEASVNAVIYLEGEQGAVVLDGERYILSDYEMRVLKLLCERSGTAVSREELMSILGAEDGNMCDVYICRLRKKLELGGERKVIYTVRGKGYMTKYSVV